MGISEQGAGGSADVRSQRAQHCTYCTVSSLLLEYSTLFTLDIRSRTYCSNYNRGNNGIFVACVVLRNGCHKFYFSRSQCEFVGTNDSEWKSTPPWLPNLWLRRERGSVSLELQRTIACQGVIFR